MILFSKFVVTIGLLLNTTRSECKNGCVVGRSCLFSVVCVCVCVCVCPGLARGAFVAVVGENKGEI